MDLRRPSLLRTSSAQSRLLTNFKLEPLGELESDEEDGRDGGTSAMEYKVARDRIQKIQYGL
jgi:hypothetical protein